jgi:hypothetical protein
MKTHARVTIPFYSWSNDSYHATYCRTNLDAFFNLTLVTGLFHTHIYTQLVFVIPFT